MVFKLTNNQVLGLIILGAILYFVYVQPCVDTKFQETLQDLNPITKIDINKCSKNCCKFTQWPIKFELSANSRNLISDNKPINTNTNEDTSQYIGTNYSCNFGQGSGCLCMTKEDLSIIENRGSNTNMCNK